MDPHDVNSNFDTVRVLLERVSKHLGSKEVAGKAAAGRALPPDALRHLNLLQLEFQGVYFHYVMSTAAARVKVTDPKTREEGTRLLRSALSSRDYSGELRALLSKVRGVLVPNCDAAPPASGRKKTTKVGHDRGTHTLLEALNRLHSRVGGVSSMNEAQAAREAAEAAARAVEHIDCDHCEECGTLLVIDSGRSEARCPECQRVFELHGVVYEDAQFYAQEGQRVKSGCFSPNRHLTIWMNHILALEPESEIGDSEDPDNQAGEKLIAALHREASRMNFFIQMLTVTQMRKLLKAVDRTDLNRNVPLLLKKMTGIGPPSLSEAKRVKGEMMFSQAIQARTALDISRANRNYYPYYIYKIYDLILAPDDPDRLMLWFIHLQGAETLSSNDREWKAICEKLEWKWWPTDPAKTANYRTVFGGKR
jgi:hypothetical protein